MKRFLLFGGMAFVVCAILIGSLGWKRGVAHAAGAPLTKATLLANLSQQTWVATVIGAPTQTGAEANNTIIHYSQSVIDIAPSGQVAKVSNVSFFTLNEGTPTEQAFYDAVTPPISQLPATQ